MSSSSPGRAHTPSLIVAFLSLAMASRDANAQVPNALWRFTGTNSLGRSVADVGDLDGDGASDFLAAGYHFGYADVRSGSDGTLLFHISTGAQYFGEYAAGGGDVNADGIPDFALSSRKNGYPSIQVYSGRDASLLLDVLAVGFGSHPQGLAFLGDLDGDGHDDLIVGCPYNGDAGYFVGEVFVFSGRDGSRLYEDAGTAYDEELGTGVAALGDVDGDQVPDFAYTSLHGAELLRVISGRTFVKLFEGSVCDSPGWAGLHTSGDIDGDGIPDLVVGCLSAYPTSALVLSGSDFSTLRSLSGTSFVSSTGGKDLDLDGVPDIAFGGTIGNIGLVSAYSGKTGGLLWTVYGLQSYPYDQLGFSIDMSGDANRDGFADVIAGAPVGQYVEVISGNPSPWAVLGGGRSGTKGEPRLRGLGFPAIGYTVTITLTHCLEDSLVVFIAALAPLSAPLAGGGTFIPSLPFLLVSTRSDASGLVQFDVPWPNEPPAVTHWIQAFVMDPTAPGRWAVSNGLTVTSQ
ncbi:MAG: VCBS repeat-containing protein [Planctomycetota bacterium]